MAAKPLSIADRIRAQRNKNRSENERQEEQRIVNAIKTTDPKESLSNLPNKQKKEPSPSPVSSVSTAKKEHSKGQSAGQSKERSLERSGGHSNGQTDSRTVTLADTLADSRTVTLADSHFNTQQGTQTGSLKNTLGNSPATNPFFWITPSQAAVLNFLITIPSGKTRLSDISGATGVPYGTVRKSISTLEKNNCITKPKKLRIGQWQGMHIEILDAGKKWSTLKDSLPDSLKSTLKDGQSGGHSNGQSLISSSSLYNKTTTIPDSQSEIESYISDIVNTDPEYTYWIEQQVTPKQITAWKKEFGLDLQTILNNLCYIRWQITKQGTKVNKSAADMLYSIMKKNGGTINKPANYKSMAQLDLEFFENWKNQRAENSQKIEALKQEAIQAEIEPKVTALLSKPDLENEHIKEALEKVYPLARKNAIISRIQSGGQLDSKERVSLKRCLEDVLISKRKQP